MPQAEILENLGESKYRVRVLYDDAQYQSVLSRQQGLIAQLGTKIADAETKAADKQQALDALGDTYEDAATLLTDAERLQSSRSALDAITKRVSELRTLVESLDAKLEAARSDEDATELRVTELEQEVVTKTAERDSLQSEYDSLVYLRDLYTTECRLDGYEGENCVLAQDYKEQAESKKEELDDAQQALDDAENELGEARDRLSQLRKQISTLQSQLQSEQPELTKAEGDLVEAQANHDAAFAEYASTLMAIRGEAIEPTDGGYEKQVEKHQKEVADALAKLTAGNEAYQIARLEVDTLKASRKSQQTRLKAIEKTETGPELECWTSAWNDTLEAGEEVEVVLIPGEATGAVIHETDLPTHRLTPPIWQTPAQCLFNYMMLPSWQRWQYRFGTGVVTSSPADGKLPIEYEDHPSSVQQLRTSREEGSADLEAGESAAVSWFTEGDHVLLRYPEDGGDPTVEGFYVEPKLFYPLTLYFDASDGFYGSVFYYLGDVAGEISVAANNERERVRCWYKYAGQPWNEMTSSIGIHGRERPGHFSVDQSGPHIEFYESNFYEGYLGEVQLDGTTINGSGDWVIPQTIVEMYCTFDGKRAFHCAFDPPGDSYMGTPIVIYDDESSDPVSELDGYVLSEPPEL